MKKCACFVVGLLLCIAAVCTAGFPELPTADPLMGTIIYGTGAKAFLRDNLFAITFFVASFCCGLFLLFYSIYSKMKKGLSSGISDAVGALGVFVILTGIWIFTDSRFFQIFKETPEKTALENAIALISFVSFLLLPVIYSEFLKCFVKRKRFINILENLMVLNILVFLALLIFKAAAVIYLAVLFVQHGLIVILIVVKIKRNFKDLFRAQNIKQHNLAMGTTLFGIISVTALIAFMTGEYRIYPVIYGLGLFILIFFMVKMLFAEIAEIRKAQIQAEMYKEMAYADALTGLPNRNAFIRDTDSISDTANLCVVIMDINNIKIINDTYGHESGDTAIVVAADVLRNAYGDIGKGYRIGGDEFAVICHNVGEAEIKTAVAKAEKLQTEYNEKSKIPLNIAVGYAMRKETEEMSSFSSIINEADRRMYADKLNKKKQ